MTTREGRTHRRAAEASTGCGCGAAAGSFAIVGVALALCLVGGGEARADITLLAHPLDLVFPTETMSVVWEEPILCRLAYGRAPGTYTDVTAAEGVGSIVTSPAAEGMSSGVHYCVVRAAGSGETSEEFVLVVESERLPTPRAPGNGSVVRETTTVLSWDPVDGVPYYHVVVSDREVEIEDEGGGIVVSGLNVIWQAITSGTSIQYGSLDPSGHFVDTNGASPPLMSGFTYNWLVLNNYGCDPLLTSTAGAGLAGFTVDVPTPMPPPALIAPPDSVTVGDDILDFEWSPVPGAFGYHLYLYEERVTQGARGSYVVWDGTTTAPGAELRLASFLPSGTYFWRALALDAAGRGVASETRSFRYETETGVAAIATTTDSGPLPRVLVQIRFSSGGIRVVPTITNESGFSERKLVPGEYTFTASKDGYVDSSVPVTIVAGQTTPVVATMTRAPARIRGLVVDESAEPVFDATVTAASAEDAARTTTDADGRFVLALSAGVWTIEAEKPGHEPAEPESVTLVSGDYLELADALVLERLSGSVTGHVLAHGGYPVLGATVWADGPTGLYPTATAGSGRFSFRLTPGLWTVWAEKSGYRPTEEREVSVAAGEDAFIDPPLVLTPAPCAIVGRVTDGVVDVSGALVSATPPSGTVFAATTNRYGEFVLLPDPATYVLSAAAPGYGRGEPLEVSVANGESFTGVVLEVRTLDSAVDGSVVCGADPLEGASVTDGCVETATDTDGRFTLSVAHGVLDLSAGKDGFFAPPPFRIATAPGQTLGGIVVRMARGASSIAGRVRCGTAGVAGAVVSAEGPAGAARTETDASGLYRLRVEAGEWRLTATKDCFAESQPVGVVVGAGQAAVGIDLLVEEDSAVVLGSVTDNLGAVRRASVLVHADTDHRPVRATSTDSNGAYRIRVAPGLAHVLEVRAAQHGERWIAIPALDPGATHTADATLPTWDALVSGFVKDERGRALEGVRVVASWGDSASARTNREGAYSLWLDDGLYDVRSELAGHRSSYAHDVQAISGETTRVDATLEGVFASLEGLLTDSESGAPLEGVLVTAAGNAGGASDVSDAAGWYSLGTVVPGAASFRAVAHGYRPFEETLTLGESESRRFDVTLLALGGLIAGRVTDSATGAGLPCASMLAKLAGVVVSSAVTDPNGAYTLTDLDPDSLYEVHALKEGHLPVSENPLTAVATQTLDANFTLVECSGRITGRVLDATSGDPLSGATVRAASPEGFYGTTTSGSDGCFELGDLAPFAIYDVTASLYGYFAALAEGVPADVGLVTLELARNFASIEGAVTAATPDIAPDELRVVATSTAYGQPSRLAAPLETGEYVILELRPGSYVVSVVGTGCVGTPTQVAVHAGEGEVVQAVDFVAERAAVARVEIAGPASIEAGEGVVFSGDAVTADGRLVAGELTWWAAPPRAGLIERDTGRFRTAPDYLGEVSVGARDLSSGAVGTLATSVHATVGPTTWAAFVDSAGLRLEIPPGALASTRTIHLSHETLTEVRRLAPRFEVEGFAYRLEPDGLLFSDGCLPVLAIPAPAGGASMAVWDQDLLRWNTLEAERVSGGLAAPVERLGEYASIVPSGPLAIGNVRVAPNPFSPDAGPVVISYEVSSREARMPFITVRVFTMAAQRVREIVVNQPEAKGRAHVTWDGLTDSGEMARNGRYVIEIEAEDPTGTERALATVVLAK